MNLAFTAIVAAEILHVANHLRIPRGSRPTTSVFAFLDAVQFQSGKRASAMGTADWVVRHRLREQQRLVENDASNVLITGCAMISDVRLANILWGFAWLLPRRQLHILHIGRTP